MFALFFNLYLAMFRGVWGDYTLDQIGSMNRTTLDVLGQVLTSLFNNVDQPVTTLGNVLFTTDSLGITRWMSLVAFVLALITSIGIVVMAVKGVKKAFGIFFMGLR